MKNHHNPDESTPDPFDPEHSYNAAEDDDDDRVEAIFIVHRNPTNTTEPRDRYDLGWLFLCLCWEAGYGTWEGGLRSLARTLRGLEKIGMIERHRIRREGRPTHHGFVLTEEGQEAVSALSGEWIKDGRR